MNDLINKETLERLREGDQKAFERVFLSYRDKIKTFIRAIIKSETDAEDLTQDIFAKLWHHRETVDPRKSFTSYIYVTARNAAFNYLKHKTVIGKFPALQTYEDTDIGPEEIMYAEEIGLLTEMALSRMPEQRRKIYRLSRHDGLTNDDIATQLNISKKTVENQLSAALKSIRKVITVFLFFFA